MKKILHKLRVWLIRKLGGVPKEAYEAAVKAKAKRDKDIINRDRDLILSRMRVKALNAVIREIAVDPNSAIMTGAANTALRLATGATAGAGFSHRSWTAKTEVMMNKIEKNEGGHLLIGDGKGG